MSMAFLGVVMFMPLYMQVVQGINATQSGFALLPLMGGLIVSSIICGRLVTRTGRYKPFMIGGGVVLIAGVVALTGIGPDTTHARPGVEARTHRRRSRPGADAVQPGDPERRAARPRSASRPSMSQFSRQMGATVGVAMFGTFLTHGADGRAAEARAAAAGSERAAHRSRARTESGDECRR